MENLSRYRRVHGSTGEVTEYLDLSRLGFDLGSLATVGPSGNAKFWLIASTRYLRGSGGGPWRTEIAVARWGGLHDVLRLNYSCELGFSFFPLGLPTQRAEPPRMLD